MKNKTSIWSMIILIATILSLILLISQIIILATNLPVAVEAARQSAISQQGASEAEANMAAAVVLGTVIGTFIFASVFDVLKIIGGFFFSLKGRWGIFCIVVSILGAIGSVTTMITNIQGKASGITIATDVIGLIIDIILIVACFKHRAENEQLA